MANLDDIHQTLEIIARQNEQTVDLAFHYTTQKKTNPQHPAKPETGE